MRILIISLTPVEALTSAMFRTLALARGLAEEKNQVDFLSVPFNTLHSKSRKNNFADKINVVRTQPNAAYKRVIENEDNKKSTVKLIMKKVLRKVWHSFSVYDYTYTIAKNVNISRLPEKYYDIVISSSDPKSSHIAVKTLKKQGLTYGKWIQYWGDPLAADITQKSIYPQFILKHIERKLIHGADKIVYVSPFTLKVQQKLYSAYRERMTFLPIAYMEEEFFPDSINDKFVIGYYGNYSTQVRDLRPFYEACKEVGGRIAVSIYGDSDLELEATDNIHIYPRGTIEEHKRMADLLVCVMNSHGTQIPGKLYHLAGTNKKVLVVLDGEYEQEMSEFLKTFHRFYLCKNDKDSIRQKVIEIMEDGKTFEPVKELKYDYIASKFI